MEKLVISGSASLQKEIGMLMKELSEDYLIIDHPKELAKEKFSEIYPSVHKKFFENIKDSDVLLLFNPDKNGVEGYIGAESFAELCFALALNLVYEKNIKLFIYKIPAKEVNCYNEIELWLKLGWIQVWESEK